MIPENNSEKIIELLRENNSYLKQLLEFKKKEQKEIIIHRTIHTIFTLLPFIIIIVVGYFIMQSIMHYLDILNTNVNALKSNFDTLREFLQKLIPDFSQVLPKLQETWQNVQFWK